MLLFIINIFLFFGLCFVLLHFLAGEEEHLSIIIIFSIILWAISLFVSIVHLVHQIDTSTPHHAESHLFSH